MRVEIEVITPQKAQGFLDRNHANRRVRHAVVQKYAAAMARGEWQLTHQGIAVDTDGNLIDGQHRLMAIAAAQTSVTMTVTYGVPTTVFGALDQGVKRNLSDHFNDDKFVAQPVGFLARLVFGAYWSIVQVQQLRHLLEPWIREFCVASGTNRKSLSSAPVKAAALINIMRGQESERIVQIYNALVNLETQSPALTPQAHALIKVCSMGQKSIDQRILFVKALRMFQPNSNPRLLVHSPDADIAEVKKELTALLEKMQEAA